MKTKIFLFSLFFAACSGPVKPNEKSIADKTQSKNNTIVKQPEIEEKPTEVEKKSVEKKPTEEKIPTIVKNPTGPQKGVLSKDEIRRGIRNGRRRIKYCYEKELFLNPQLKGQLKVEFTIGAKGTVISAFITLPFQEKVDPCVIKAIKDLKFPKPRGGGIVIVRYPFNFVAQKTTP